MSLRRIATACAGPLLIVGAVAFALRGFVFHDALTDAHPDLLAFWLPRWTFLGRSLAAGHVPLWNPYEMAGYRFAADPQSGWLYAPAMVLFSRLSPGAAIRAMVVLNPVLAGLGLYAFLRVEGFGRVAATTGGLSLASAMSTSEIALAMPFAGALAWSTVTLLAAAGCVRSSVWSGRIAWLMLGAFGWSQIASAHLSHGLAIGTAFVVAYLVAKTVGSAMRGDGRTGATLSVTLLFVVVVPLASIAVLAPRLSFIERSSLGTGYDRLGAGVGLVSPAEEQPIQTNGVWAGWPLASSAAPGAYAGAIVLLAVPAALRAQRRRAVVVAFAAVGLASYVLLLDAVIGAGWVRDLILRLPYGDVLLHNPGRLRYAVVLALPVLGAAGIQGLIDDPLPASRALLWVAVGAVLWLGAPLAAGAQLARWSLFAIALIPAVAALMFLPRRPEAAAAVVAVLCLELVGGAVLAGRWTGDEMRIGLGDDTPLAFQPSRSADVDLSAFLRPGDLVGRIGPSRYLTWVPPDAAYEKGYLFSQQASDWPALTNERGSLFSVRDVLGYNPVQLPRYWAFIRTVDALPISYNAAVVQRPSPRIDDLLAVAYLIVPEGVRPPVPGTVIASDRGYDLVRVSASEPLVSAPTHVRRVPDASAALRTALRPRFDPSTSVALESDPGIASGGPPGSVTYEGTDAGDLRIDVDLRSDAIVLVRIAYDAGWSATVDGRPEEILPADGFLQGIPVRAGAHTVVLAYRDDAIFDGLWWSAAVWAALIAALLIVLTLEWRAAARSDGSSSTPPPAGEAPPR
jgi:Bacterial membrane protein YfhO